MIKIIDHLLVQENLTKIKEEIDRINLGRNN